MKRVKQKKVTVTGAPPWLPLRFRSRKKAVMFKFRVTAAERRVYRKPKPIPPSKWAERYRVMTYGPLAGGKWDNSFMPHLSGIMDASFFPSVKEIGICKTPQTRGSVLLETCLGYAADTKPAHALVVFPDKDTATKRSTDYLQDVFRKSPRLQKLLTGFQDDMAGLRIKLLTMLIYMGWAGSVTSLANISAKYVFADEVDKWPETPSKKEASSFDLVRKRVLAFKYGSKIWWNSTPTIESGFISQYLAKEAQVIFDYWARCPGCGEYLLMEFGDIDFCGERDPIKMETEEIARYACKYCGEMWDDYGRDRAVRRGQWRARDEGRELMKYMREERPAKIAFHIPSWISPLVSLSAPVASFLRANEGTGGPDKKKLKEFANQHEAKPWVNYHVERQVENILKLRDDRPRELVPGGGVVQGLLAAVDTQDDGFWYEIRAWGWGPTMESWQIRAGLVPTFEALEEVLFGTTYKDGAGNKFHVQKAVIDAMGHRTSEVYDFCRKYRGRLFPLQGVDKLQSPWTHSNIDTYPGKRKLIPGGIILYRIDTNYYKDTLATKLEIAGADPGAWHLHSEVTQSWCKQMTVEFVNDQGKWDCPAGKANHAWDVSVYGLFAADFFRVKYRNKPKPASEKKPAKKTPKVAKSKFMSR